MNTNQKNCPLCDKIANFDYRNSGNEEYFDCECCKNLTLIGRAKREHLNEDEKREWSKLSASLSDEKLLYIYYKEQKVRAKVVDKVAYIDYQSV